MGMQHIVPGTVSQKIPPIKVTVMMTESLGVDGP